MLSFVARRLAGPRTCSQGSVGATWSSRDLQAAVAASAFLLNADGDIATAHRLLVRAIESRVGTDAGVDPLLEEALNTLMMVCYYGGRADL